MIFIFSLHKVFKEELLNSGGKRLIEAVRADIFSSAGLSPHIAESIKSDLLPGANRLCHVLESVRCDLIKEAILCNDLHEIHVLSEEIVFSSDETSCGLPITDLATPSTSSPFAKWSTQPPSGAYPSHRIPTPLPILTPHSPLPLQPSTSNRFNNNLSSGDTTHSLTI